MIINFIYEFSNQEILFEMRLETLKDHRD